MKNSEYLIKINNQFYYFGCWLDCGGEKLGTWPWKGLLGSISRSTLSGDSETPKVAVVWVSRLLSAALCNSSVLTWRAWNVNCMLLLEASQIFLISFTVSSSILVFPSRFEILRLNSLCSASTSNSLPAVWFCLWVSFAVYLRISDWLGRIKEGDLDLAREADLDLEAFVCLEVFLTVGSP